MAASENFDRVAELDLFAQHFTVPLGALRHHQVLITDKTPANVLALARLVLDPTEPGTAAVLAAAESLYRAWMLQAYDVIVYCRDRYDQTAGGDLMRGKVLGIQDESDTAHYQACRTTGVPMLELPSRVTVSEGRHPGGRRVAGGDSPASGARGLPRCEPVRAEVRSRLRGQDHGMRGSASVVARGYQAGFVGQNHELGPVAGVEFGHGPVDVGFRGHRADHHVVGDLVV